MAKHTPPSTLLTKKKQAWVDQWKPTSVIRGTPLNFNAGVEAKYAKELTSLVKQMTAQANRELVRLFKSETASTFFAQDGAMRAQDDTISSQARIITNALMQKFQQLFTAKSKPMAERMTDNAAAASKTNLHASLKELSGGLSLKTDILTDDLSEVVNATVVENVALIRSIASEYLQGVQGAVMRSITTGNGLQTLVPYLQQHEGITLRRARNIAIDQTRKAYNNINKERMQAVGLNQYQWLHTGGAQKPRKLHEQLSGQVFSFDNPPVIDEKTGERGIPGQLINCGCRMVPVISFDKGSESGEI